MRKKQTLLVSGSHPRTVLEGPRKPMKKALIRMAGVLDEIKTGNLPQDYRYVNFLCKSVLKMQREFNWLRIAQ
jgi:hypothetical protein